MPRSRPSLLVAGWIGSTNLGDELAFEGLRRKLEARDVGVVAISVDPETTERDHGVEAVRPLASLRRRRQVTGAVLGGGGLLQDKTSPFNAPYHLARVLGPPAVPFAGVGLGVGPLTTRPGLALVRSAVRRAVALSVRDEASAAAIARLGVRPPVVAADLAVAIPRPQVEVRDRLVAALRPWWDRRWLVPVRMRRERERAAPAPDWFIDGMAAALDEASARTGLAVHLVAFQSDRDHAVHELVAARMAAPVTTSVPDRSTVVAEVASGRVVVAMRYHAAVAAMLGGRPAALIGYAPKVPSLASDLGEGAVSLSWSPDDIARLPAALEAVMERGDAMSEARERLRAREKGNDAVLDRLLDH